jgi:hypothetical protein
MVSEYYALVSNYINQDKVVLFTALLSLLLIGSWHVIKRFKYPWLNKFYVFQMLCLYLIALNYFGVSR